MSTPETCRAAYRNVINLIQSHLVGQLLNLIVNGIFDHFSVKKSVLVPECMFSAVVLNGVNCLRYLAVTLNSLFVVPPLSRFTFSVGLFSE